ncbi:hypothetical protein SAMN06265378_1181 [Paracoccus sediminis]|nr:hypothetical protein SAMN06265378_1181 [Paracoccus sediminis]
MPTAQEIWRHLPDRPAEATKPPGAEPVPVADPAPAAVPRPAPLSRARVVIHRSRSSDPRASRELARRLREAGAGQVEIRDVGFRMARPSIRYFHAGDRTVSDAVGDLVDPGRRDNVADFTHFRPLPRRGTIEVWLP